MPLKLVHSLKRFVGFEARSLLIYEKDLKCIQHKITNAKYSCQTKGISHSLFRIQRLIAIN